MNNESKVNYLLLFGIISLLILAITIGFYCWANWFTENTNRGTFGDMFGALNAVFSGLAFAGVIITVMMQMKELELTREELRKSSEAQNKSQIALFQQLEAMNDSTKLESISKLIEIYDKENEKDRAIIAKESFKELSKRYFLDPKLIKILEPKMEISAYLLMGKINYSIRTRQISYENYTDSVFFSLNIVLSVVGPEILLKPHVLNHPERHELKLFTRNDTNFGFNEWSLIKSDENVPFERNSEVLINISNIRLKSKIELKIESNCHFIQTIKKNWLIKIDIMQDQKVAVTIKDINDTIYSSKITL